MINVKAAQKGLKDGRDLGNKQRKSKRAGLKTDLAIAVKDYMDQFMKERKVPNKEIANYLAKQGFQGKGRYGIGIVTFVRKQRLCG